MAFTISDPKKLKIIIPTYNAAKHFPELWAGLCKQDIGTEQILVIDSSSSDETFGLFQSVGVQVVSIPQASFNHGGTRRFAAQLASGAEFLIFLTQDAIPASPNTFSKLLQAFDNEKVGMAYGCQLPRPQARAIERHARVTNYPQKVIETRLFEDRKRLGIKAIFCSDSFAAYRNKALDAVGGFPEDAFFGEDQIVAGKMLKQGWALSYLGDTGVTHSHGFSIKQDFKRYFDVGVFHARNSWLIQTFGRAEGEGMKFVLSELRYLARNEPLSIPSACIRTFAKYAGYRLGLLERHWSYKTKKRLSMSPYYWVQK